MAETSLTTTSYIVLGLLTSRDWSAYELAEQVGRGVDHLWARADRQRYNTVKRLAELGLVEPRDEGTGRRSRTVYSITPSGLDALGSWLGAGPPAPLAMEFEAMVRVLVAEQGTVEDLRAAITAIRTQAVETLELFGNHADYIIATAGTFPEREHLFALVNRFMIGHAEHLLQWADWALEHAAAWSDTTGPAEGDRSRTHDVLRESSARAKAALAASRASEHAGGAVEYDVPPPQPVRR